VAALEVGAAPVTVPFTEDFESGALRNWATNGNVEAQSALVATGSYAARVVGSGDPSFAELKIAPAVSDTYVHVRFIITDRAAKTFTLVQVKSENGAVYTFAISARGELVGKVLDGRTVSSRVRVDDGQWHQLELHLSVWDQIVEVWMDGEPIGRLTAVQDLGSESVAAIVVGDTRSGRTFDVVFDDVAMSDRCVGTCARKSNADSPPTETAVPLTPTAMATTTTLPTQTPEPTAPATPTQTSSPTASPTEEATLAPTVDAAPTPEASPET